MSNASVHLGGVSADPERQRLRDAYPVDSLTVERFIPYEEIERVINIEGDCPAKSNRFYTATKGWRDEMERLYNIMIGPVNGEGLKVLSAVERVGKSERNHQTGMKHHRKAHRRAAAVDRAKLSEEDRRRADHVQLVTSSIIQSARRLGHRVEPTEMPQISRNSGGGEG